MVRSTFLKNLAALDGQTAGTAFTPWSLERLEAATVPAEPTSSVQTPLQTRIQTSGNRFQHLSRRLLSFTAVCLAVVAMTLFSINYGADVLTAASHLVEQVSEIIPVSGGQVDQSPADTAEAEVVTETTADDNLNPLPPNPNPPPPDNGGRGGNSGLNGGEQSGRWNGSGN